MNEFCKRIKEEIKPQIITGNDFLLYAGNEEEIECKNNLRKQFIDSGNITDPDKEYNLELSVSKQEELENIIKNMEYFSICSKSKKRGKKYIAYIKDAENISTFLSAIGAAQAVLDFENIRIKKSVSSDENRKVNFEVANLNKSVNAGLKQVKLIKKLYSMYGAENLPQDIKELCETRLENPDKSFYEIAEIMGGMSKSKINHRFRKIKQMVDNLS